MIYDHFPIPGSVTFLICQEMLNNLNAGLGSFLQASGKSTLKNLKHISKSNMGFPQNQSFQMG